MRNFSTIKGRLALNRMSLLVGALLLAACAGESTPTASLESDQPAEARTTANSSIVVSPATLSIDVGENAILIATVFDRAGLPILNATVSWTSSRSATATVSAAGVVSGVSVGSATITARRGSATKQVSVRVTAPAVHSIVISPTVDTLVVGATLQLTATLYAASGAPLSDRPIAWTTSNPAIVTVNAVGLVVASAAGTALISASSEGKSGSAMMVVVAAAVPVTKPGTVTTLAVTNRTSSSLTLTFTGVGDGAGGSASYAMRVAPPTLNWGSTPDVTSGTCAVPIGPVTVGSVKSCTVTGLGAGAAYEVQLVAFRGTWGSVEAFGALSNVASGSTLATDSPPPPSPAPVASVTVAPTSASILVGSSTTFTATLRDSAGNALTGRTVSWVSGNTSLATVVAGVATGIAAGTTSISATSEGRSASVSLTVTGTTTPGLLLSVNWSTATGNSVNAVGDGGKGIMRYCSWPEVLSVVSGGPLSWTRTANVLRIRSVLNCGHVEFDPIFPEPRAGQYWAARYYVMNGVGQTDTKMHPHTHFPVGAIEAVHTSIWPTAGGNGNWQHGSTWPGVLFPWHPMTAAGTAPSSRRVLTAGVWYRYEYILHWTSNTQFRVYPRLYDMAGNLLNDATSWRHTNGQGNLSDWYAAGNSFTPSTPGNMRNFSFGMGQGGYSGAYYYVADARLALVNGITDFIGQ